MVFRRNGVTLWDLARTVTFREAISAMWRGGLGLGATVGVVLVFVHNCQEQDPPPTPPAQIRYSDPEPVDAPDDWGGDCVIRYNC